MGGTAEQTQKQESQTQPWDQAQGMLKGILAQVQGNLGNTSLTGAESGALTNIENRAASGNPFAPAIGSYATSLLNGGGATGQAGNVARNLRSYGSTVGNLNSA